MLLFKVFGQKTREKKDPTKSTENLKTKTKKKTEKREKKRKT